MIENKTEVEIILKNGRTITMHCENYTATTNVVIYLTHEFTNLPSSTIDNRKEYVAITRARYYLYVLNTKCEAAIGD